MKNANHWKILAHEYAMHASVIVFIGIAKGMQAKTISRRDVPMNRAAELIFMNLKKLQSIRHAECIFTWLRISAPSLTAISIPTTCYGSGATVYGQLDAICCADVDAFAEVVLPVRMLQSRRKR